VFGACTNLTSVTFLGNAPILYGGGFYVAAGAKVYYYYGTTGWGPTYGGLPMVMLGAPAPQVGAGSAGVKRAVSASPSMASPIKTSWSKPAPTW